MANVKGKIGIIGLGVMGRNFLLNIASHGFSAVGYDRDLQKVSALKEEGKNLPIVAANDLQEFLNALETPKSILLLVPAGAAVDAVINELVPLLQKGDLIIDAGNSYFKDTNLRMQNLEKKGIHFLGVGISGGEEGARNGPSLMPAGPKDAYERIKPIFEAAAAKVNQDPCVTYLGQGSAGHYVKMVHNGIEYAIMQLIAESYDIMKRGLGKSNRELHEIYSSWNKGKLNSYLIEITAAIFGKSDVKTGQHLIDEIRGVANQNGTGMWTSQSGNELQEPIPTIDIAVCMRDLSSLPRASSLMHRPIQKFTGDTSKFLKQLENALFIGMIASYAQGLALLALAAKKFNYQYDLESIVRIWRGGCIIRSALLETLRNVYKKTPMLSNIFLDKTIADTVMSHDEDLRQVIIAGATMGIPIIGLMTALGYLDAFRSEWLPDNLIQAQRDYFGAHTVELFGRKGTIHIDWETA